MSKVVFLPGWGFKANVWDETIRALSIKHAIALDLPKIHNDDVSQAVIELSHNIENQSIIVAWSVSGLLAIQLAFMFPEKCAKLVLVNSLPKFVSIDVAWKSAANPGSITDTQKTYSSGIPSDFFTRFCNQAIDNLDKTLSKFSSLTQFPYKPQKNINKQLLDMATNKINLLNYLLIMKNTDCRHYFSNIAMPIFCIVSDKDAVIPNYNKACLKKLNPNITYINLKESSHAPFITNKNVFNPALMDVLSNA